MSKLGLVGLVLSLGVGCFGDDIDLGGGPALQDAWGGRGLEGRYMVGSEFPIEVTDPDRALDAYEVASLDPSILELVETADGIEARALAVGETQVELYERGDRIRVYDVSVTVPDELRVVTERRDLLDENLQRAATPVGDEVAMLAGSELFVHVRYFEAGERVYGGNVLSTTSDIETSTPEWSPQGNVVRLQPSEPGTYSATFQVGSLEQSVDIHVVTAAVNLELSEPDPIEILLDESGGLTFDQLIKPQARDAEGRILRGTLPITWTMDGMTLGTGTLLGVGTEDMVEAEVTATLGELSATYTARGTVTYVAP